MSWGVSPDLFSFLTESRPLGKVEIDCRRQPAGRAERERTSQPERSGVTSQHRVLDRICRIFRIYGKKQMPADRVFRQSRPLGKVEIACRRQPEGRHERERRRQPERSGEHPRDSACPKGMTNV
jgi:hypothetical protein